MKNILNYKLISCFDNKGFGIKNFKYLFIILYIIAFFIFIEFKNIELLEDKNNLIKIYNNKYDILMNKIKEPFIYIRKTFDYYLSQLPQYNHSHEHSNKIFWCWLQGEKQAPKLALACLNSLKKNCKNHEIIIITEKNIHEYIHFPSYILQKFKNKTICKTHFSDLLRLELLIKYGGTWTDASVLLTKYDENYFNKDLFFFQTFKKFWIAGSNWFITSEKKSPILRTTRDLLYEFWRKNNKIYNYFLFHIYFKMACDRYIKDYHKIKTYSNKLPHMLQWVLFEPFRLKIYKQILLNISIHKLTVKKIPKIKSGLIYHHIIKYYF